MTPWQEICIAARIRELKERAHATPVACAPADHKTSDNVTGFSDELLERRLVAGLTQVLKDLNLTLNRCN